MKNYFFLNGKFKALKNSSAEALSFRLVTKVMAKPKTSLRSSSEVSEKTVCSLMDRVQVCGFEAMSEYFFHDSLPSLKYGKTFLERFH